MWDLPRPGIEPVCPALAGRLSTTAPPGKPTYIIYRFLSAGLLILCSMGSALFLVLSNAAFILIIEFLISRICLVLLPFNLFGEVFLLVINFIPELISEFS